MSCITLRRSVVPACDVDGLGEFIRLINSTRGVEGIGAYKVDMLGSCVMNRGLDLAVEIATALTDIPLILDCQKAGTDIPDLGEGFAARCSAAGVDAVILFPFAGAETEEKWITACQREDLDVIVGAEMTQKRFKRSEGGFIADEALEDMFRIAADLGVRDFVVPGNKVDTVLRYADLLKGFCGDDDVALYAPGFVAQGGKISEAAGALGDIPWHAIVGRGIYEAEDMTAAAQEYVSQIAA